MMEEDMDRSKYDTMYDGRVIHTKGMILKDFGMD